MYVVSPGGGLLAVAATLVVDVIGDAAVVGADDLVGVGAATGIAFVGITTEGCDGLTTALGCCDTGGSFDWIIGPVTACGAVGAGAGLATIWLVVTGFS